MDMKVIVAAAAMMVTGWAGSAGATTVTGSDQINNLGDHLNDGSTVTVDSSGDGIADADFVGDGRHYFDFIYSFTLDATAKIDSDIFSSGGSFAEFHAVVYDAGHNPQGTDLYRNPDPDHPDLTTQDPDMYKHYSEPGHVEIANTNLIDIKEGTSFISAGSSNGNGVGVHLDSLDAGTYYLRLFGVAADGSSTSFSGELSVSAVVSATPIPPAVVMFVTALGGLGFAGWRRGKLKLA